VLDGATSQWKRSDCGSAAIGPPAGSPAAIALDRARGAAHRVRVAVGRERASSASSSCVRAPRKRAAAEQHDAGVDRSPRSTRGTTRSDRVLERLTRGHARPPRRTPRRLEPRAQVLDVDARRGVAPSHSAGTRATTASSARVDARREPRVGLGDRAGERQQHVVADRRERRARARSGSARGGVERRAVVDQPQVARASEQVRVARRAVDVGDSASSQTTSAASSGRRRRPPRVVGQRAGQEVDAEVEPALAAIRSWISGSGSARAERRVELDEHELGHRQPERAGQLAGDDLGHERLRPCPAPRNLRT
jgi:hypothetical protein